MLIWRFRRKNLSQFYTVVGCIEKRRYVRKIISKNNKIIYGILGKIYNDGENVFTEKFIIISLFDVFFLINKKFCIYENGTFINAPIEEIEIRYELVTPKNCKYKIYFIEPCSDVNKNGIKYLVIPK